MLSAMQYPHWLMVAGAVLVVAGFIGLAFAKTGPLSPITSQREMKAKRKRPNVNRNLPGHRSHLGRQSSRGRPRKAGNRKALSGGFRAFSLAFDLRLRLDAGGSGDN